MSRPRHPADVLSELGARVRTLARQQHVAEYGRRLDAGEPVLGNYLRLDLIELANRCAQWAWGEGPREDPVALEAEARAVLAGGSTLGR